ncbi:hypothetical protein F4778DRAFT_222248 [Xylariomycetidae sp. FL2044]|nr:hypothetical protein F4778DRAFT_222248 [Xylariomycetidae sp. FL2044]
MGDVPHQTSAAASEFATQDAHGGANQGMTPNDGRPPLPQGPSPSNNPAFYHQQVYGPSANAFSSQLDLTHAQVSSRQGAYNMAAMAQALPQAGYRPGYNPGQQAPRFPASSPVGVMPHVSQMAHFVGQPGVSQQLAGQPYYVPQHPQMPQFYNAPLSPAQPTHQAAPQAGLNPRHNVNFYSHSVMMNSPQQGVPTAYYYPASGQFQAPTTPVQGQMAPTQFLIPDGAAGGTRGTSSAPGNEHGGNAAEFGHVDGSLETKTNVVRGPPRKPRQSGHAIWIGNLPPQTDLMNLVHHVCKEAIGLESLFLISKSNCAFANFKDETTCVAAQQKLHDSKFQSVRLVSRLRKSTVEGAAGQTAPTGPAATSPAATVAPVADGQSPQPAPAETSTVAPEKKLEGKSGSSSDSHSHKDKFFILKSLTVEDLELSVRNGVWATQSHNEQSLNQAFKMVDNVYLVFSANKSGEYFGYARMTSPINDDPAAAIQFAPKAQATTSSDLPKAIATDATDTCPKGRIIDDSARGTIFWEVDRGEVDGVADSESDDSASAKSAEEGEGGSKAWGKPFKLEWLSTTRLPFYRTRGLRNPWNSNREVKIARDGTELEPTVGRRLIGLFNRVQSPAPPMPPLGVPMMAGYPPPMHPPYRQ